ncbi:Rib/alpha-like domain-containing protein [Streptococcus mitis]|uniref:Rib/alpha-like domain-containing protein n=1 Tax=Streptococcus mitis TaxID=28037 RepID=UPI0021B5F678|nr:Rib/alpha-like domain-containing protein [Streptococcus mitis]
MFKPKGRHVRQSQVEKFTRYSIRKVSFGAASVAVATGLFFLGGGSVQAAEQVTNSEPTEVQNPQNVNEKSSEPSKEVAGQASATAKEPDGQNNTSVKESTTDKQASAVETPNGVAEKVTINTASLEDLVAKVEGRLSQLTEDKKTKSVIDDAKNLVNKAKDLLNDDTKTQAKVNALAKQLSSSLFILNSIKSEATKVNKNQNPRNGQAIPSNGESGFRTVDTTVDTTAANAASEAEKYKGIRDAAIPELQANIDKIQAEIAKEEAKSANKKDQFKIDVLKHIKQKAENVITTANAADVSSAQIMSQQAEAVKSERDLLALYLAGKADLGAPVSENHVAYGNNPTNGVFESLKEGFGDKVTFTDADKKSKTIVKQQAGPGEINARTPGIGNATYNWQERTITKAEAEAGLLNGWKIEKGEKVNAVKPLEVTDITDKDGAPSTRVVPKSKIYTNDEELIQYQREGAQLSYNAGSGIIPTITPTINAMRTNAFGEVKNRDYYLELGSKGTTISKEFDVNGNSRLNVNLIHSGAYGHASTPSTGEKVKLKIVDAFTGAEIKPVDGKSGPLSTEQGPGGGNGWTYMARLYDIPATTTKIKVLIEAGDQGTGLTTNPFNRKGAEIKDGYLVGGIGIATAPAAEIVTDVSSGRNKNEYGYTPDTIYDKNQKGSFNFTLKDTAGMNIDYYAASNVQVTIKVPKGVVLEDRVINANGGSAFLGGVYANSIRWTPNDSNDNSKGGTLTYNVPADKRMAAAEKTTRSSSIVFTTANNFIGPADFKVTATSGFGDTDAEGNKLYSYTTNGLKPAYENQFHRGGLANSDNPDFEYGKVIYINSLQATGVVTVPINTNNDQLKEVAYAKAQEEVNSANFQQLLRDMNATAAMGQITNVTLNSKDKVEITKIAADGRGVVKVPVTYTADGRTYDTTVDIEVNVVKSTTDKLVVFEGDKITNDQVKSSVTPATIDTKAGVVNNPNESDVFSTTGKAGEAGLKIPTTVTHDSNGTTINETVEVPVTVLPKPTGEVEVPKGESVDKVKEVAKAKATELVEAADFKGKLPTGATVTVGDVTEAVAETLTNEKGTNKGVVNVPATYTVDGKTYDTTIPVTINVLGSEPKTVYTLEGTKPDVEKVKAAVTPGDGGTVNTPKETDLPATTVKAGTPDVTVPTTVTYSTGDETVKVPVEVLPKATPEKVTTLKDTTGENLTTAVKEKAQAALGKLTLPSGVTVELVPNQNYAVPATDSNGDKTAVPVKVQYKDATGTVVAEDTINVPVTVVSSTPKSLVVFEGDEVTADAAKGAVTPGTDGTKGEPTTLPATAGKAGATDVKVDVPVTYDNGKLTETVSVPVTVLPKPEAEEILVAKNSDKEKAKEKVLAKAKKAIEDSTFTGKLPQGATVTVDETATVTVPDLTEDTEVEVTVKYTVPGQDTPLTTTVKVPVTVVEGVPQIVPVDESNKQPDPEKSIDKTDYPEDATFEYKEEVDTSTPGDKKVTVVVKQGDKVLVEVPSTVRVVGSTPQFVVADPAKKQPEAKDSVTPGEYPEGTTFEYKTPVDTTTAGEKDVTVVAKLNGQPIAEVPAKVVVVDPKTQYVVADPSKPQPDASKSIDPEQYPDGTTFEYKTPVDTTTTGEKDVVVVAKNGEDKLVEVPTKVKVVQGNPQIVPVDEGKKQPSPEDSIDSNDYPDDATFEYKEEVDTSTPGDKKVTVVVKQGDKVLVEVPSTVRVVGSTPQFVVADPAKKQPEAKDSVTPGEYPEGTTFEYKTPVDTTTAGEKDVTVVAKLNGQPIAEVPAKVVVVDPKTQYVVADPSKPQPDASKSIDPEQYPDGTTFEYKTPVDTTTPGEKDVVVVAKDGEDKLVEVPTKVKVVQGNPQIVPVDEGKKQPSPEDSIDPNDYPDDATFEYKEEVDTSTPGDKKVTVVVKQGDKVLVEVPSTVRVVESYPKYVPVDPAKKQPDPKENINPNDFPTGTTFEYKDNTPVDTTTPGEKPVTVVAKLNGQPITEIPATIVVVEPKTQYVPVNAENDKKPKPQDSITPDDYPAGSTFEYKTPEGKTEAYDGSTPGDKDVTVVVKDSDGDTLVEVPAKIKVVQGKEQLTPVNAEDKDKPKAEDSITPSDYPEGSTFEYKVPEGQTTPYDGTTPGDKPVIVVVKDKDGKVLVEVPATIKVVETKPTPIETPVTTTPLTPEDYTKGIKIPEGGKVTNVANIPDLTTPGKKDPVKVTITLPNGKSYTVDVPVTVTPIEDIVKKEGDPITNEDVEKHIPKGAKVISIGDKPTTDIPGERPSIPVVIELPNGIRVTVNVPVIVTPKVTPVVVKVGTPVTPEDVKKHIDLPNGWKVTKVGEIPTTETPVTTTPLTPEDYTKGIKIPEGGKVTNVANIPDLTTPGKKDPVKVTITLPNGKSYTVDVPVTVTPIEDIVKKEGDPITNEDVEKHIPKGAKVISIGDKPTTDIPGERPSIPVVIELPNGIRVTVNVPVIVTPKVTPVVVKVGTPVTPEDVKKHIDLPNGWKVTKVGEIPTTETPGTKPVVSVEIQLPDGRKITVDVPVIVTPTVRQIVVPQGTPVTPDDVKGHIDLPKEPGWEIVEVGEIPTTETPGTKPFVKVKVKLPDGRIITVDVPVTVTPKSQNGGGAIAQNGGSTVQIVTEYLDENGNRITSDKEGKHNPIELEGYEFSHSTTDAKGNTLHHYKKVKKLINQEQPSSNDKKELPNTGTEDKAGLASLGLLGMLGAFGLVARKKKED